MSGTIVQQKLSVKCRTCFARPEVPLAKCWRGVLVAIGVKQHAAKRLAVALAIIVFLMACNQTKTDADAVVDCALQQARSGAGVATCTQIPKVSYTVVLVPRGGWSAPKEAPLTVDERAYLDAKKSELGVDGAVLIFRSDGAFSTALYVGRYLDIPNGIVVAKPASAPLVVRLRTGASRLRLAEIE
jgi:hypothetical protein